MSQNKTGFVNFLQEFSIPLIAGVFAALAVANLAPHWYEHYWGTGHGGDVFTLPIPPILGHEWTLHFLINDLFMVFFFGIAAKEITEACLPGGSLNPLRSAINPLLATVGGVLGPVLFFFVLLSLFFGMGAFEEGIAFSDMSHGWGVPTATDIALAWLVARMVFGNRHPAVKFLLLLAVADDAIGLAIIAIFYGDPLNPARPEWLGLVAAGMALAFALRKTGVKSWIPYVLFGGGLSWVGLLEAHLHPALALVPIVPFLPAPKRDVGLFVEPADEETAERFAEIEHSTLERFEHQLKRFVDVGLFFFAFANAGVQLSEIGPLTWTILGALVLGKVIGIFAFGWLATRMGFPLPKGMTMRDLAMTGYVAALGLTVALFVAGAAFVDPLFQGEAKMGALFSGFVGLTAILVGRLMGFGKGSGNGEVGAERAATGGVEESSEDVHQAVSAGR